MERLSLSTTSHWFDFLHPIEWDSYLNLLLIRENKKSFLATFSLPLLFFNSWQRWGLVSRLKKRLHGCWSNEQYETVNLEMARKSIRSFFTCPLVWFIMSDRRSKEVDSEYRMTINCSNCHPRLFLWAHTTDSNNFTVFIMKPFPFKPRFVLTSCNIDCTSHWKFLSAIWVSAVSWKPVPYGFSPAHEFCYSEHSIAMLNPHPLNIYNRCISDPLIPHRSLFFYHIIPSPVLHNPDRGDKDASPLPWQSVLPVWSPLRCCHPIWSPPLAHPWQSLFPQLQTSPPSNMSRNNHKYKCCQNRRWHRVACVTNRREECCRQNRHGEDRGQQLLFLRFTRNDVSVNTFRRNLSRDYRRGKTR